MGYKNIKLNICLNGYLFNVGGYLCCEVRPEAFLYRFPTGAWELIQFWILPKLCKECSHEETVVAWSAATSDENLPY